MNNEIIILKMQVSPHTSDCCIPIAFFIWLRKEKTLYNRARP